MQLATGVLVIAERSEFVQADTRRFEAVSNRVDRDGAVVPLAAEALLLCGGDDTTLGNQCGRAVVIKRGQPQMIGGHAASLA